MLDRIDFVPQKTLFQQIQPAAPFLAAVLALLPLLYLLPAASSADKKLQAVDRQVVQLQEASESVQGNQLRQQLTLTKQEQRLAELSAQNVELLKTIMVLESTPAAEKKPFSTLLLNIAASLPASMICEQVKVESATLEITGEAKGYAALPNFIDRFKKIQHGARLDLSTISQVGTDGEVRFRFSITGTL